MYGCHAAFQSVSFVRRVPATSDVAQCAIPPAVVSALMYCSSVRKNPQRLHNTHRALHNVSFYLTIRGYGTYPVVEQSKHRLLWPHHTVVGVLENH